MNALLLNILIFGPLLAAVVVWCLPERRTDLVKQISLIVGFVVAALSLALWAQVGPAAMTTGSTESCGAAPWACFPWMSMRKWSTAAKAGPGV